MPLCNAFCEPHPALAPPPGVAGSLVSSGIDEADVEVAGSDEGIVSPPVVGAIVSLLASVVVVGMGPMVVGPGCVGVTGAGVPVGPEGPLGPEVAPVGPEGPLVPVGPAGEVVGETGAVVGTVAVGLTVAVVLERGPSGELGPSSPQALTAMLRREAERTRRFNLWLMLVSSEAECLPCLTLPQHSVQGAILSLERRGPASLQKSTQSSRSKTRRQVSRQ